MSVIERTERGFAAFVAEEQETFDAMRAACPTLYHTLLDLNRASFYAGCEFEREWERGVARKDKPQR